MIVPAPVGCRLRRRACRQALVNLLSTLPCRVTWVDERPGMFATAPSGVICRQVDDPNDEARSAAPGSYFVVMTHHHPRDL
ncbi:XdhC family protein, partial [Enterococcus faecium]|uniref:XdhC family protein n=1 Tax=Enterococcus faecium TaxID=1352 RepID=UPI003F5231E2